MIGLPPGTTHTFCGPTRDAARARDVLRDGLAELRKALRRAVVGPAFIERLFGGVLMWGGVSKSGWPISRWMMLLPCASSARARTRTSNADSTPMRCMRLASFM